MSDSARRQRRAAVVFAAMLLVLPVWAIPVHADDMATAPKPVNAPANAQSGSSAGVVNDPNYRLGAGDRVRVTVFGQEDLSGTFQVDGEGKVALPLVGNVQDGGQVGRA